MPETLITPYRWRGENPLNAAVASGMSRRPTCSGAACPDRSERCRPAADVDVSRIGRMVEVEPPRLASCGGRLLGGLRGLLPALRGLSAEFLREPFDPAFRIDQLLFAREERMAVRADFEVQLRLRRAGLPFRSARAAGLDLVVLRVNSFSHSVLLALVQKPLFYRVFTTISAEQAEGGNGRRIHTLRALR